MTPREDLTRITDKKLDNFNWDSITLTQLFNNNVSSRFSKCFIGKGRVLPFIESDLEIEYNKPFWNKSGLSKSLKLDDHYYYRIENCYLNPRHGLVIVDDHIIEETKIYTGAKKIFNLERNKTDHFFDIPSVLFSDPKHIDYPVYALSSSPGMNYCHFNLDILSGLIPILDFIKNGKIKLLWSGGFSSFQKQILDTLGISEENIIIENHKLIYCKSLIKSSSNFHTYKRSLSSSVERYFPHVIDLNHDETNQINNVPCNILIERSNKTTRRKNNWERWDEVVKLAKSKNFIIVDPGTLSFTQQIKLFSSAKVIIAQHGAALTNCGYISDDTHVIEILPDKRLTKLFYCLSKLNNARHYILLANSEKIAEGKEMNAYKFQMPIKQIINILKKIL